MSLDTYYYFNRDTRVYQGVYPLPVIVLDPANQLAQPYNSLPFPPPREAGPNEVILINEAYDNWVFVPDFRGSVYQKADGQLVKWKRYGKLPTHLTHYEPKSQWDEWDDKKGNWLTNHKTRKSDLNQQYCYQLDQFASHIRQRFISGQPDVIDEYKLAEEEAQAFKIADYQGEVPECIQADVDAYGRTPQEATDHILAESIIMKNALRETRRVRLLGKGAIKALPESTTEDELQAEFDVWKTKLDAISPPK